MRVGTLQAATLIKETPPRPGYRPDRWAMLTPTYRPDVLWQSWHLTRLLDCVRVYLKRKGHPCRYAWVAETQRNGRVHWHILVALPRGVTLPKPDKQGWWPHGMTRIEWARNAVGYLVKYASKGGQNPLPKGCRMHGCGGLTPDQRLRRSFALAPRYVRDYFVSHLAHVSRAPGGGWFSKETGEWIPAPPLILDFRSATGPSWSAPAAPAS